MAMHEVDLRMETDSQPNTSKQGAQVLVVLDIMRWLGEAKVTFELICNIILASSTGNSPLYSNCDEMKHEEMAWMNEYDSLNYDAPHSHSQ